MRPAFILLATISLYVTAAPAHPDPEPTHQAKALIGEDGKPSVFAVWDHIHRILENRTHKATAPKRYAAAETARMRIRIENPGIPPR